MQETGTETNRMVKTSAQTSMAGSGKATVSVVVPSYNHAPFIETCLRSIIKQTLPPVELIVIDDGSTDNSTAMIERMLEQCPFPCELVARENRGLCATLNEGLRRAGGKYFAYLGSDDVWLAGFLQSRVDLLETRPAAVLGYGHAYLIDEEGRIVDSTKEWAHYQDGNVREMLLSTVAPMSPTVMYRRRALERHGWNEQARLEDYDLYLRLSQDGEFAFDPQVLSAWRHHGYNTSLDQMMMLNERLRAQRELAPQLGISAPEIEKLQTAVRFICAEDFLRIGAKAEGLRLMYQNLGGAASWRSIARMIARLLAPYPLMQWRQRRRRRKTHERYGILQG